SLAIEVAKQWNRVIVSADSRQCYKEMETGTAKPTNEELKEVPHYFINSHSIHQELTASQYANEASLVLQQIFKEHNGAVLVGGSGLYIKALIDGLDDIPEAIPETREKLNRTFKSQGIQALQDQLKKIDPKAYETIDLQNPRRLVRALEVYETTGHPISHYWQRHNNPNRTYQPIKIGLFMDRAKLYERIDQRCDQMLESGLLQEVKALESYKHLAPLQSIGYKEFFDYLEGTISYEQAVLLFKKHTRNLAKRQLTWFRRDEAMQWFQPDQVESIRQYISKTIE
ncbi:MAG: tRNA (adenosine(37)-N6)-dimethylallyltransferase MiaA, partial [Bacteroidetes bacterium SW_10_40_5]